MEPCLRTLEGSGVLHKRTVIERVSEFVGLTDEQRHEMLDSGRATVVFSRVGWALSYLKQAGLVANPKRGHYELSDLGAEALASDVRPIDTAFLARYEGFQDFRNRSRTRTADPSSDAAGDSTLSPEEQLTAAVQAIRAEVQSELLDQLKGVDPAYFEKIVVDVLRAMGYGVDGENTSRVVGRSGDEGIDGIIDEDLLGLDSIYIQAKRWQGPVGRPEVQGFAGALQGQSATKGVMITTSVFSEPAREYVRTLANSKIVLIDGQRLAGLMYDHQVGVSDSVRIVTRRFDSDYFLSDA